MILKISLASAGIVNLLPTLGVWGPKQLETLYGIPFTDANVVILMRHRAVMFGMTGTFMLAAAFYRPQWQGLAVTAGLTSMLSFAALAISSKSTFNAEIRRVVVIDLIASAVVIAAAVLDSI